MQLEFHHISQNPVDTLIDVYEAGSERPFAQIDEADLMNTLTFRQCKQWFRGRYIFTLPKGDIIKISKKIY